MPLSLVDNTSNFVANVAAPAGADSPLASGQLRTALQDLADRTGTLKRLMDLASIQQMKGFQFDFFSSDASLVSTADDAAWHDAGLELQYVGVEQAHVGDQLIAMCSFVMATTTSSYGHAAIAYQENNTGVWNVPSGTIVRQKETEEGSKIAVCYATITTAGQLNVRLQATATASGDATTILGPAYLVGILLRNQT